MDGDAWSQFFREPMLSLPFVRERGIKGHSNLQELRSLYWKIYLEYLPSFETSAWPLILEKERGIYGQLKGRFISDPSREAASTDLTQNNPLSLNDDSPWKAYFQDVELMKVIRQDVERTFPDHPFFRDSTVQDLMVNILFVWCKLNPFVSYRQGMHELLAPIVFTVDKDKFHLFEKSVDFSPELNAVTFDANYVEHDSFVLFNRIMKMAKDWFINDDQYLKSRRSKNSVNETDVPILRICNRIQNEYVKYLDFELFSHLQSIELEPQLYGLRWIRLLFGREVSFTEIFCLWDGIFADDANLSLAEWVAVAMLLSLRKELLEGDLVHSLQILMKFPQLNSLGTNVQSLIDSARKLRERYNQRAGETTAISAACTPLRRNSETLASISPSSRVSVGNDERGRVTLHHGPKPEKSIDSNFTIDELVQEHAKTMKHDIILAKKLDSCISHLRSIVHSTPNHEQEFEGIIDEVEVVKSELERQVCRLANLVDNSNVAKQPSLGAKKAQQSVSAASFLHSTVDQDGGGRRASVRNPVADGNGFMTPEAILQAMTAAAKEVDLTKTVKAASNFFAKGFDAIAGLSIPASGLRDEYGENLEARVKLSSEVEETEDGDWEAIV